MKRDLRRQTTSLEGVLGPIAAVVEEKVVRRISSGPRTLQSEVFYARVYLTVGGTFTFCTIGKFALIISLCIPTFLPGMVSVVFWDVDDVVILKTSRPGANLNIGMVDGCHPPS